MALSTMAASNLIQKAYLFEIDNAIRATLHFDFKTGCISIHDTTNFSAGHQVEKLRLFLFNYYVEPLRKG
jgi:hypothetical protein